MNIRVTQSSITRQYKNNMNSALSQMNSINNKILTQRKFLRASEDPVAAARALTIRRSLSDISTWQDNLDTAKGIIETAESTLTTDMSPQITTITTKIIYGINGDKGDEDREIIANEIEAVAKDLIKTMNSEYSDRRLYGGTNNSSPPFSYDENTGFLSYNGEVLNSLQNSSDFPGSNPIMIDVGLGIQYNSDGTVDPSTAIDISVNGAEITGCGIDKDGDSNNVIQLSLDAAKAIKDGDDERARELLDKINAAKTQMLVGINKLGVKETSIDYYIEKVNKDEENLMEAQVTAEGMTLEEQAEAMTEYKSIEATYNAVLQMGSNIIPVSIFDFI